MTEETKQSESIAKALSADTVWPPPPDVQEETAAKEGILPVVRKPDCLLAVLQGLGLNLVSFWFLMIAGNVFFPQKIVPHGSETDTFFWNVLGLSLAVDTVASAFVPKNKTYSAYLILGAVLMSIVSWWFNCILLDISI